MNFNIVFKPFFKDKVTLSGKRILEGNLNYIAWKDRMEAVLEDNGLKEFKDNDIPNAAAADAQILDAWHKKVGKARRILLEGV